MKRQMVLLGTLLLVLLVGCGRDQVTELEETKSNEEVMVMTTNAVETTSSNVTEEDGLLTMAEAAVGAKAHFDSLPEVYSIDSAIQDGALAVIHGNINGGWERWEEFVQKAEAGENASIVIIQCTIEGDPILTWVQRVKEGYYCCSDSSRDEFAGKDLRNNYQEGCYKFLKCFEESAEDIGWENWMLVNDDTLTMEQMNELWKAGVEENYPDVMTLFTRNLQELIICSYPLEEDIKEK